MLQLLLLLFWLRYGGWARFQRLLQRLKAIAGKHAVSIESVALRWLIDQGTFPVIAARWSASAGPWATLGHTYSLHHDAAVAGKQGTATDTAAAAAAAGEGGREVKGNQPDGAAGAAAAAAAADKAAAAVLGGGEPFVPGVDAALFQVASFLDAEDVAALSGLCGGAAGGM